MIEKASIKEAENILFVINTSNRETYHSIFPREHFKEPVLSLQDLHGLLDRMHFFVYRSEDTIVGVAALSVESVDTGQIHWVYILPEYQRRGIGTALMRHLEQKAMEKGLRQLKLHTAGIALWAITFYQKLGYGVTGKVDRPWGFDVVMMKDLKKPKQ